MIWVPRRLGLAAGLGPLVSIPGQRVHVLYSPVQCGLNWFPVRECGNKAAVGIKVKDGSCSGVGLSPSDRG
ncbi:hypothetical protein V6N13_089380 [Hibiscus sabdariffa]